MLELRSWSRLRTVAVDFRTAWVHQVLRLEDGAWIFPAYQGKAGAQGHAIMVASVSEISTIP